VLLATAAYDDGLWWSETENLMIYDNEAGAQYLYSGVDRVRANIATSQAAYAEASKRTARDRDMAAPRMSLAKAVVKWKREAQLAELSID
jgi:hypothetical protein